MQSIAGRFFSRISLEPTYLGCSLSCPQGFHFRNLPGFDDRVFEVIRLFDQDVILVVSLNG